ncbi:MAG: aminotransferase class I/II-fold pyridoxal phosphate-dependent enzyme [Bacteroidota bacterium]
MLTVKQMPGREIQIDGQRWLYFSGTAYLGISQQEDFRELLLEGMARYGSNFGGSRLSNIRFSVFEEVEDYLAQCCGATAALTFSSGTVAGQVLSQVLKAKGDFYYAPATHPALWTHSNIAPPLSYDDWVQSMIKQAQRRGRRPMIILANALDPLYVRPYDFDWIVELDSQQKVYLVIDDSHGVGIRGLNGGGIYRDLDLPESVELIVVASMGKAWGIPAGLVLGSKDLIGELMSSAFFGGASPAVPAYLYAFLKGQSLYEEYRLALQERIAQFVVGWSSPDLFQHLPHYPVFYTPQNDLADFLAQKQILISNFPYPRPTDNKITRVVINSLHREADISFLLSQMECFVRENI